MTLCVGWLQADPTQVESLLTVYMVVASDLVCGLASGGPDAGGESAGGVHGGGE